MTTQQHLINAIESLLDAVPLPHTQIATVMEHLRLAKESLEEKKLQAGDLPSGAVHEALSLGAGEPYHEFEHPAPRTDSTNRNEQPL